MHFETFASGTSLLHKLDPRVKLITAFILAVVFALVQNFSSALLALLFGLALVLCAGFPLRQVLSRMAVVNVFIVFLWLLLPFSHPGDTIFNMGPFTASIQGVKLALLITIKSNAIVLLSLALLCSMRMFTLVRAMEALHVPNKLVQILFFSLRYFQVIHEEYHRLHEAMRIRAFKPKNNMHTWRSYGYLVSMLLVRSLNRGQRVYEAMLCRGYTGQIHSMHDFCMTKRDSMFAVFSLVVCVCVAGLQWTV